MFAPHRRIVILLTLLLLSATAGAQEVFVSVAENFFTRAHRTTNLVTGPLRFQAFDAGISWRITDSEAARLYASPRFGIGFSYANLGSCEFIPGSRLGDSFTFYACFDRPLLQLGAFSAGYALEFGAAIMTHWYDRFDNPANQLYGGPYANHAQMGAYFRVQASRHLALQADVSFRHNSNGRLFVPNGGVNSVSCALGASYAVGDNTLKPGSRRPAAGDPLEQKFRVALFAGGGIHRCMAEYDADRLLPPEERQDRYTPWFKGSVGAEVDWRYSRRSSTGVQAEFWYLSNTEAIRRADDALYGPAVRRYSPFAAGIGLIQDFYFGSFTAGVGLGGYLFKESGVHEDNGRLYQKVYLRYYPPTLKHFFAGAAIRAHQFGKADYIEFSIGTVL